MTTWYSDLDSARIEEMKTKITNSVILSQLTLWLICGIHNNLDLEKHGGRFFSYLKSCETVSRILVKMNKINLTYFDFTSFFNLKIGRESKLKNINNKCISRINRRPVCIFVIPVGPFHIQFRGESAKSCHFAHCQVRSRLEDFLWPQYIY